MAVLRKTEVRTQRGTTALDIEYDEATLDVLDVRVVSDDPECEYVTRFRGVRDAPRKDAGRSLNAVGLKMRRVWNERAGREGIAPDFDVSLATRHGKVRTRPPRADGESNTVNNPQSNSVENASTVSVASYAVGSEANRVLVAIATGNNGTTFTFSSCVFNTTETLTEVVTRVDDAGGTAYYRCSLYHRVAPSNATANVALTASATLWGVGLQVCYLSGVEQDTAEASATAEDFDTPHEVTIGAGITVGADVVYGGIFSSGSFNITALTASGCTARTSREQDSVENAFVGMASETAAGSSETGGWTHDGTGGTLAGTMVAGSWAPQGGGGPPPQGVAFVPYRIRH
ncbi:MAG: hypothetical protein OEW52_00145 [Thermoleophilia bacterium]|nr:hypothetical protein [Thermoleophilia bacterium]